MIYSGHGLQPLWPIEDGEPHTDEKWSRAYRFAGYPEDHKVANDFAAGLDNVSDPPGILRVLGMHELEGPGQRRVYAVRDTGAPLQSRAD